MADTTQISKGITIEKYKSLESKKNKVEISEIIYKRFHERYIKPHSYPCSLYKSQYKNGFSIMASCCLLIEAYESFKKGLEHTNGTSKEQFIDFFNSEQEFEEFNKLEINKVPISKSFYKCVRCGILHQGETLNGWKITRKGIKLFDEKTLKLDATLFMELLDKVLKSYCSKLEEIDWDDPLWKNARKKMYFIIKNCQAVEK